MQDVVLNRSVHFVVIVQLLIACHYLHDPIKAGIYILLGGVFLVETFSTTLLDSDRSQRSSGNIATL
jgi:hypothetical protein